MLWNNISLFKDFYFDFWTPYMYESLCRYVSVNAGVCNGLKRVWESLKLEVQVVMGLPRRVLRTTLWIYLQEQ